MRDLNFEELDHVYGAGGAPQPCYGNEHHGSKSKSKSRSKEKSRGKSRSKACSY